MTQSKRKHCSILGALAVVFALTAAIESVAQAAKPFRYAAGKSGAGELRWINELPVLTVEGSPEEIGKQIGELAAKPAARLMKYPRQSLEHFNLGFSWGGMVQIGESMTKNFPPDHLKELEAVIQTSNVKREAFIAANTMFDVKKFFQCSTLLIEPSRSAVGGPLLGRNLDFQTLGYLHEYTLVTVYKSPGKHAFASVGFPGMVGCLSGINDAGLSVAVLEVYSTKQNGAKRFDAGGTPYAMCFRRMLEECETVDEALKLLRTMKRTTMINLAVSDKRGGGVFEITSKSVEFRKPANGVCACTNHFRTDQLAAGKRCWRYPILASIKNKPKVQLSDVAEKLHAVNQGKMTLQTMVFEPVALKLHLAFGALPSSSQKMKTLELAPLFAAKKVPAPAAQ
ncbi:MAG: C45 family peptidase [Planctomycetales bacterium]